MCMMRIRYMRMCMLQCVMTVSVTVRGRRHRVVLVDVMAVVVRVCMLMFKRAVCMNVAM